MVRASVRAMDEGVARQALRACVGPWAVGFIIDVIAWNLLEIIILSHLLNHLLEGGRLFCHPHRTTNTLNVYNKKRCSRHQTPTEVTLQYHMK